MKNKIYGQGYWASLRLRLCVKGSEPLALGFGVCGVVYSVVSKDKTVFLDASEMLRVEDMLV